MHTNKLSNWFLFHLCVLCVYISTSADPSVHSMQNHVPKFILMEVNWIVAVFASFHSDIKYGCPRGSLFSTVQLLYSTPTVLYNMKAVLHLNKQEIQSHTWKYFWAAQFPFSHIGCSLSHLKYPDLLLGVCPDGWRAWAGGTKQIIGWSSSGWKGFRAGVSEASRPAEHNEVTLPGTERVQRVQR